MRQKRGIGRTGYGWMHQCYVTQAIFLSLSICIGLLLTSCLPIRADVRYAEPAATESTAIVMSQGNPWVSPSTCQFGASGGVCRAWLSVVEGRFSAYEATGVRVMPGEHAIKLGCNSSKGPLNMASSFAAYHGPFEASRTYYIRCVVEDGTPRIWIAGSVDGPALPEFIFDPPDPDEKAKIQKLPWYDRPIR